jgi:alpha-N-arabinofuranosidase
MNQGQKELRAGKQMRAFKLWAILAAVSFSGMLAAAQFLPGGTRKFSDTLRPLFFLFVVSVVMAAILIGLWAVIRPPFSPVKFRRLAIAFTSLFALIAVSWTIGALRKWMASSPLRKFQSVATVQVDGPRFPSVFETNNVRVTVEAAHVVHTVDSRLFGINTAIWDALLDTEETVSALRELDLQVLRFPGGSFADKYHWTDGRVGHDPRPLPTSFFNFMHMATNLGAQVIITVNYGSGTPEEAAAWVRCANISNRCGFKYWEIGNENYGDWEHEENSSPHDPVTYATRAKEYIRQMKAADPSIKVGVVVTENWMERAEVLINALKRGNLRQFIVQGYQGWTPRMLATLKQLSARPDWVSLHYYPEVAPGWENDARLLQSGGKWAALATPLREHLKTYFGDAHTNVEMLCTENNSVPQSTGKQTTSLVNGLYLADSFGEIAETEFNSFLWWDLRNVQDRKSNNSSSLYGWRPYGDHGIMSGNDTRYPTFYVFKLLKYFARGGDRIMRATSDNPLLSVYAARRVDETLALLVINKSPQTVMNVNLSIAGLRLRSAATMFSYGLPQDEAARTGSDSADIAQTILSGVAENFSCLFSPYSVNVIVLSPSNKK